MLILRHFLCHVVFVWLNLEPDFRRYHVLQAYLVILVVQIRNLVGLSFREHIAVGPLMFVIAGDLGLDFGGKGAIFACQTLVNDSEVVGLHFEQSGRNHTVRRLSVVVLQRYDLLSVLQIVDEAVDFEAPRDYSLLAAADLRVQSLEWRVVVVGVLLAYLIFE